MRMRIRGNVVSVLDVLNTIGVVIDGRHISWNFYSASYQNRISGV